jgi:isoquinoline 1-oxidoreductase subunit alpha
MQRFELRFDQDRDGALAPNRSGIDWVLANAHVQLEDATRWDVLHRPLGDKSMTTFTLNGRSVTAKAASDTPLLWVIREEMGMTGTKFACGIAQCGACTVHLNGTPTRSCSLPLAAAAGARVTTIEGLAQTREGKALQDAWIAESAPQCGYCQSGQMMAAAAVIKDARGPMTREQALERMAGNICRCGTYNQIAAAVVRAQKALD